MTHQNEAQKLSPKASVGQLVAGLSLSYLIAIAMLTALVVAAGVWNFLGISRLLDPLIQGGIVQYHDKQLGFIAGVPELKYYVASQDPLKWVIIGLSVFLMFSFWAIKSLQFHSITRAMEVSEGLGPDSRAFLFGQGLNRWLPFGLGDNGTTMALKSPGRGEWSGSEAVQLTHFFMLFEICFFALVGLLFLGWDIWLTQIFWALVILIVAAAIVRPVGAFSDSLEMFKGMKPTLRWLLDRPVTLAFLIAFSVIAFFLEHASVFFLSQAFSSPNVIMNIEFHVFLMAIVAGNIARLVPVTPGGLGQFEWAFAATVYLSGTGMPEAASIALLFAVLRYGVGFVISSMLRLFYKIDISARDVLANVSLSR